MRAFARLPPAAMEWRSEGLLLAVRRHGETGAIIETLTAEHGRHAGLVRGGAGRRHAATLQPGNQLHLVWRGRIEDQLGSFEVEPVKSRAAHLLGERRSLAMLDAARALICALVPERLPAAGLYAATVELLETLPDGALRDRAYIGWELRLLAELGFALDLRRCAATGSKDALVYVSPRSGRAVSHAAGAEYADRLLPLPAFMTVKRAPDPAEFREALALTGYFLERWAAAPLGIAELPAARVRLAG